MAEADDGGAQLREAPDLRAVERRVEREPRRRLVQAGPARQRVLAEQHVGRHERPVCLAPERDQAGGVAGRLQHRERADPVALAQAPRDRRSAAGPRPQLQPRDGVERRAVAQVAAGDRVRVAVAGEHREVERARERGARALVVGVRVGDEVAGELAAGDLAHDPPRGPARAGVDDPAVGEVDVDGVARDAVEQVESFGDLFHTGVYGSTGRTPLYGEAG